MSLLPRGGLSISRDRDLDKPYQASPGPIFQNVRGRLSVTPRIPELIPIEGEA